jgi:hypothetical protein
LGGAVAAKPRALRRCYAALGLDPRALYLAVEEIDHSRTMTKSPQTRRQGGGDFLHDLDLEITLSNRLPQPRILGLGASGALMSLA